MNAQPQMSQTRIDALLLRWEELRERGRTLSAAELAADSPELIPELADRIAALRAVDAMLAADTPRASPILSDTGRASAADQTPPGPGGSFAATVRMSEARFHARGGLGEVLIARQDELSRRVAVKRIRPDKGRPDARRRFLREAAITAGLQHPGIVPIYALGQDEHGPFYVMPFVEGQTLDEAIQRFHGEATTVDDPGRRALEFRGLLQRLVTVCETMAYAHDRGVVHRDLKPSNIMLGPYGETLVMDWGLAKRYSPDAEAPEVEAEDSPSGLDSPSERLTATGAVLGTPQYMSPEQAIGQPVGPASDVFSMGAILRTILASGASSGPGGDESGAGGPPARRTWWPPGRRQPGASAALQAICTRATAAEPGTRYESAGALADDLTKWLAGEPVSAYREPIVARMRRWVRRHPRLVTGVAAASLMAVTALVALTAVVSASNRRLERTNEDLARAHAEVEEQRDRAEEVTAFLVSALRRPDPDRDGKSVTVAEVLGRTPRDLEKRTGMAAATRVSILDAVGQTYLGLGMVRESVEIAEKAGALAVERLGREHAETLRSHHNLALAYLEAARFDRCIPLLERTLEAQVARLGADHPDRFLTMSALARAYLESGQPDRAIPLQERALANQRARLRADDPDVITSMNNLARAYKALRQPGRAIPLYEEALAAARARMGAGDLLTLGTMHNLAATYAAAGQLQRAIPLHEQVLAAVRAKLGEDHPHTLAAMNNLARAYSRARQYDRAIPLLEGVLKAQRVKLGEGHLHTLTTMSSLAQDYLDAGRLGDAIALNEEALRAQRVHLGPGHLLTIKTMNELASAYKAAGRLDRALPLSEEAWRRHRAERGPDHPDTLLVQRNLARSYDRAGRHGEAERLLRQTVEACARIPSRPDAFYKESLHALGACLIHQRKYAEAEAILRESLAIPPGPQADDPETSDIRGLLGEALVERRAFAEAEPLLLAGERALGEHPERSPSSALGEMRRAAIDRLVRLYEAWGKPDQAAAWRAKLGRPPAELPEDVLSRP